MKQTPLPLKLAAVIFAASLLAGAGCSNPAVPRDLMAEEARLAPGERPVAMKGDATFAGGQIQVLVTVSRGFQRGAGSKAAPPERKGWFKRDTDAFSESYSFDYGDSEEQQKEAMQDYVRQAMARRAAGSPMPPVTLRVGFENKGTTPIQFSATEVNSDLGNFAAQPAKLTIAPGERDSLEPMVSQLGVTADEIPLKLSLRIGGKTESQVVIVKNVIRDSVRK